MNINPINFDIKAYLEHKNIKFYTSGKNTIKGAFSVRCPFHNDHSNHLNLFKDGMAKCFHCGFHNVKEYIREIEKCSWNDVDKILIQFPLDIDVQFGIIEEKEEHKGRFKLPNEFSTKFPDAHKKYLEKRGFDWFFLKNRYKLLSSHNFGDFAFRIIIPIIMGGKVVSFTSRDVSGKSKLKYKNNPDRLSAVPRNEWLMGIDEIKTDTAVIVEGPFDYMRFGDGAVALLTANFTTAQLNKLRKKGVKKVFIGFDPDDAGKNMGEKLEQSLSWCDEVNYIDLPDGKDIADLNDNEIKSLKRIIF